MRIDVDLTLVLLCEIGFQMTQQEICHRVKSVIYRRVYQMKMRKKIHFRQPFAARNLQSPKEANFTLFPVPMDQRWMILCLTDQQ